MDDATGVFSEVGRLRSVLVHQPGTEHRQTVPWNKDALLFDDVLDVEEARPEHASFAQLMAGRGVEVVYLEDLLRDICADRTERASVCREVLGGELVDRIGADRLRPHHLVRGFPDHYSLQADAVVPPLPNLYFTRDPAFSLPGAIAIAHPCKAARHREAALLRAILRRHPRFAGIEVYEGLFDDPEATIEGGDVLVVDASSVVVGVGERTNEAGAEHLARFLFERTAVERVVKIRVPAKREFMHLDTVLTFVDRGRVLTMPYLWDRPELYAAIAARSRRQCEELGFPYTGPAPETLLDASRLDVVTRDGVRRSYEDTMDGLAREGLIEPDLTLFVAGRRDLHPSPEAHVVEALREQWNDGANSLALKPGQVVCYARNDRTARALEEEGIEVLTFRGGELVRGRGGARCMSMPLRRDPV